MFKKYYEEKAVFDRIKTKQEEDDYDSSSYKPATVGNCPVPKKLPNEKLCKKEKGLRKDAQVLCDKELAEWDEKEDELDAFLAERAGSDDSESDNSDEEEQMSTASKLPPL